NEGFVDDGVPADPGRRPSRRAGRALVPGAGRRCRRVSPVAVHPSRLTARAPLPGPSDASVGRVNHRRERAVPEQPESVPPFVSFLSDYGLADEFVGVCKAVVLRAAPSARLIDITHGIPPFDVRAGALALARAVQYLPPGVVLAVVDPGVGADRRAVAVEVESGFLVGPDNGLLAPAVAMLGGAGR